MQKFHVNDFSKIAYALLAAIVLTTSALLAIVTKPPQREITAAILLIPPSAEPVPGRVLNPYLQLSGLQGPVDALSRAMNDLEPNGRDVTGPVPASFIASPNYLSSAPILEITVSAANREDVYAAQARVLTAAQGALIQLQSDIGVRPHAMLKTQVVSKRANDKADYKDTARRFTILLAVLGLLSVSLLAIRFRLRTRKSSSEAVSSPADEGPEARL